MFGVRGNGEEEDEEVVVVVAKTSVPKERVCVIKGEEIEKKCNPLWGVSFHFQNVGPFFLFHFLIAFHKWRGNFGGHRVVWGGINQSKKK